MSSIFLGNRACCSCSWLNTLVEHCCPCPQISKCPLLCSSMSSWCGHVVLVLLIVCLFVAWHFLNSFCRPGPKVVPIVCCCYCLSVYFFPSFWVYVELSPVHFSDHFKIVYCQVCVVGQFLFHGYVIIGNSCSMDMSSLATSLSSY